MNTQVRVRRITQKQVRQPLEQRRQQVRSGRAVLGRVDTTSTSVRGGMRRKRFLGAWAGGRRRRCGREWCPPLECLRFEVGRMRRTHTSDALAQHMTHRNR